MANKLVSFPSWWLFFLKCRKLGRLFPNLKWLRNHMEIYCTLSFSVLAKKPPQLSLVISDFIISKEFKEHLGCKKTTKSKITKWFHGFSLWKVIGKVSGLSSQKKCFGKYSNLPDHTNLCGQNAVHLCPSIYLDIISLLVFKA